jgi:hypothetical protein
MPRPLPYTGTNIISSGCVGGSFASSFCDKIELKALECVEYYGVSRGLKICRDHYDDYLECTLKDKQVGKHASFIIMYHSHIVFYYFFYRHCILKQ